MNEGLDLKQLPPFEVTFTSNYKPKLALMEKYEDLNSCKIKFDKITQMKVKFEQSEEKTTKPVDAANTEKDKEKEDVIPNASTVEESVASKPNVNSISLSFRSSNPRGRPRSRHRQSKQMKVCKQEIAHNKVKADQMAKKTESKNTLDYFMSNMNNNMTSKPDNQSITHDQGESKINESVFSAGLENSNTSDINIGVFNSHEVFKNPKANIPKRTIILKDLLFYLEKNKSISLHQLILYKLVTKING